MDGLIVGRADDGFSVGLYVGNNVVGRPVGVAVGLVGAMDDSSENGDWGGRRSRRLTCRTST